MADVVLSHRAEADLDNIYAWSVEEFGHVVADAYQADFHEIFSLLRDHPEAGERYRHTRRPYRMLTCRRHRVFYRVEKQRVLIVRVLHQAQSDLDLEN